MADLNENKLITLGNLKKYTEKIKELISNNSYQEITYSNLKNLRDNSLLTPGTWYRITDYETTVFNNDNARAAGHPFDVVVLATDVNQLSEDAKAVHSARDTEGYFALSNLSAWKLKYSLDNDTAKFAWAGEGKGIIYEMEDENNNLCPYDFKNIQFKRSLITSTKENPSEDECTFYGKYAGPTEELPIELPLLPEGYTVDMNDTKFLYTFSIITVDGTVEDNSMGVDLTFADMGIMYFCKSNRMRENIDNSSYVFDLNNNIFVSTFNPSKESLEFGGMEKLLVMGNTFGTSCKLNTFVNAAIENTFGNDCIYNSFAHFTDENSFGNNCGWNTFESGCSYNSFGHSCIQNTFGRDCHENSLGDGCYENSLGNGCEWNSLGIACHGNLFGIACHVNSFGNNCIDNTFGNRCGYNSFGNDFYSNSFEVSGNSNSFGNSCSGNTFGMSCYGNSFGNECLDNTLDSGCTNNSFDNDCYSNTFKKGCSDNIFGNDCRRNTFGEFCVYNSFGNCCYDNSFGDSFGRNSFGNDCQLNSFGEMCYYNSFGNYCHRNSFGNNCESNSFGNDCQHNDILSNVQYITLFEGVEYVSIGSDNGTVQYAQVLNGTKGSSAENLHIDFTTDVTYTQIVRLGQDGKPYITPMLDCTQTDIESIF